MNSQLVLYYCCDMTPVLHNIKFKTTSERMLLLLILFLGQWTCLQSEPASSVITNHPYGSSTIFIYLFISCLVQWCNDLPGPFYVELTCPPLRLRRSPQHVLICVRITGDYTLAKDVNLRVCGFFSLFSLLSFFLSFCLSVSVYSLSIFQFTSYFIVKICSS